jgi:hypothetical protein
VKEYPAAGHEFINDHDGAGDNAPPLFAVMTRLVPGMGYNEAAAQDARGRILAFFAAHLQAGVGLSMPRGPGLAGKRAPPRHPTRGRTSFRGRRSTA